MFRKLVENATEAKNIRDRSNQKKNSITNEQEKKVCEKTLNPYRVARVKTTA